PLALVVAVARSCGALRFPYTTLFRSWVWASVNRPLTTGDGLWTDVGSRAELHIGSTAIRVGQNTAFSFLNLDDNAVQIQLNAGSDRKSTRLNSSHQIISYAVFCLKKT